MVKPMTKRIWTKWGTQYHKSATQKTN